MTTYQPLCPNTWYSLWEFPVKHKRDNHVCLVANLHLDFPIQLHPQAIPIEGAFCKWIKGKKIVKICDRQCYAYWEIIVNIYSNEQNRATENRQTDNWLEKQFDWLVVVLEHNFKHFKITLIFFGSTFNSQPMAIFIN